MLLGSLYPAARAAGTYNGAAIHVTGWWECRVAVLTGDVPVGATLDVRVQESSDGLAGWSDIQDAVFQRIYEDQDSTQFEGIVIVTNKRVAYFRAVADVAGGTVVFSVTMSVSRGQVPTVTPQWRIQ